MKLSFNTVTLVQCIEAQSTPKRPPSSPPTPPPGRQRARDVLIKVSLTGMQFHKVLQVSTAGSRRRNHSRADCSSSFSHSFSIVLFSVHHQGEDPRYSSSSTNRYLHLQLLLFHLQFHLRLQLQFIVVAGLPKHVEFASDLRSVVSSPFAGEPATIENPRSSPLSSDCSLSG